MLPSYSEGLPVAVLEAWSYALPVLMTPACNLPEGFARGAALEIGTEPERIAEGIRTLVAMTEREREAMGAAGRRLVEERFTWPEVARQMVEVYRWVLGGGPRPHASSPTDMATPLVSVIVLTKDEEANLPHLLASLKGLDHELFVVDSGSTDRTVEIAEAAGATVVYHPFETYAAQRNWALANLPIRAPWVLCLDADERLTPELVREIDEVLRRSELREAGFMLRKRTVFLGRWLRFGGQYPSWHLRLFRNGAGRCEHRLYDQHFVVDGLLGRLHHDYIDVLTDDLGKWTERHNRWASLEARELLSGEGRGEVRPRFSGNPIERKRFLRSRVYRRFPLFVRPFLLFLFDYVLRFGFLDGKPGLIFHVLQRFWFRFLVDAKLYELRLKRRPATAE